MADVETQSTSRQEHAPVAAVAAMLRDGAITPDQAAKELCRMQDTPRARATRFFMTLGETLFGK